MELARHKYQLEHILAGEYLWSEQMDVAAIKQVSWI